MPNQHPSDLPMQQLVQELQKSILRKFEKRKGIIITNDFQKVLDESKRKQNKIWIDKHVEFYNRSMKP